MALNPDPAPPRAPAVDLNPGASSGSVAASLSSFKAGVKTSSNAVAVGAILPVTVDLKTKGTSYFQGAPCGPLSAAPPRRC